MVNSKKSRKTGGKEMEMKKYAIEGYTLAEYTGGEWALKYGSETVFRSSDKDGYAAMVAILSTAKQARREARAGHRQEGKGNELLHG